MYKKMFFIGIGGANMSGIAKTVKKLGFDISGSDEVESVYTKRLTNAGISVYIGHDSVHITPDIDLVVYTAAVDSQNCELTAARKKGIPAWERADFIGWLMKYFTHTVSIAGTHGKTTSTAFIYHLLYTAAFDPSISIGGTLTGKYEDVGSAEDGLGSRDYIVVEACEYVDSFLRLGAEVEVILNVEFDHPDYFKDITHIRNSFRKYANLAPKDGVVIINSDIDNYAELIEDCGCAVVTYGSPANTAADWSPRNISFNDSPYAEFDIYYKGAFWGHTSLSVPSLHNVYNALASCAVADFFGVDKGLILKGLSSFEGTRRRFEYKGKFNNVTLIDDFAHHPSEISSTIATAKMIAHNTLWVIFQPHTFSRTIELLDEFAYSLLPADKIIISDIFPAREPDTGIIHATDLVKKIIEKGGDATYIKSFDEAADFLYKNCYPDDLLITIGAGSIFSVGNRLLKL